jgi:16S rRNA (guanine966-N2)-methyltransferase
MSSPRIIAGQARGIRLQDVPGDITRPITDRVKGALFNIIGADIQGSSFLDLFGGTGSVSIEALSRGAKFARIIDVNRAAINTIKSNLILTNLSAQAQPLLQDAFAALRHPPDQKFDYVYIAPPQYKDLWRRALAELDSNPGWLADDSWVIVQIDPVEYGEIPLVNLEEFDQRRYGSTILVFYQVPNPNN